MSSEMTPVGSSWSNTTVMGVAALVAALIAMFGEEGAFGAFSIAAALIGLVPWALIAGGVRVPMPALLLGTLVPAGLMVVVDQNPGGMFPAMVALVWIMRELGASWVTYLTIAVMMSFIFVHAIRVDSAHESGMIYFIGGVGISAFAGIMLRRQDQLVDELRTARQLESEHAAATERTRIAREVHDVVAHSLTVVLLHVTGAKRAIVSNPAGATQALERAETVGRESLASIRQMVGLLRSDDGADSHGPLPTLADIPELVTQYREAGLQIETDIEAVALSDEFRVDPGTELAAFRVVQEALANVLQHAPGQGCTLHVGRPSDSDTLRVLVENPLVDPRLAEPRTGTHPGDSTPDPRRGLGVLGMHERARAAGGSVETGSTPEHTWRVEAKLPLHPAAAPLS
jgi:signal transduction histidine kinase